MVLRVFYAVSIDPVIASLTRRQHSLVAVWQLAAAGIDATWAFRRGDLLSYRRGVLIVASAPRHPAQPILAACLAAGPDAVASHWAAGALHRLKGVADGTLEISVSRRTRLTGVIVHETVLDARDTCRCQGVPTTSVARTLIDLAGTKRLWLVERALDDAIVRGLIRLDPLKEALVRAGVRPGVIGVRRLLAARRDDRLDSHQELRWLRLIRREVGIEPKLHKEVDGYEIDIAFPDHMVGFEVNGWSAHGTRSAFDHDAEKGLTLLAAGWRIGTLTSKMSDRTVVARIATILDQSVRQLTAL